MIARELVSAPQYAFEVEQGLSANPKTLPTKLFYDRRGSELFEQITGLAEYYPTRTELEILQHHSRDILQAAGPNVTIVELGAGTAAKTSTLLQALTATRLRATYYPVDISRTALLEARQRLEQECPSIAVKPVVADFSSGFKFFRDIPKPRLVLYLGSSVGNFEPDVAVKMLTDVRSELSKGDTLLLGTDLVKSLDVLLPAYDDAEGVTAEFNKNILRRVNRDLDGNFDLESFSHVARWNDELSRMEMHLESQKKQTVNLRLLPMTVHFKEGERIHTENSYKYTLASVKEMLSLAGFNLEKTWTDLRKWFALHLARI
jgi:L-histidine Nalpha-methyltransferase